MKKQLFNFILIGFLLISFSGFAQPKNYPIKNINGVDYYQYTVQVSEGLFAIGRKFEVLPEDISNANPEIIKGLKPGQKLLIPIQKKVQQPKAIENTSKTEFTEHKVLKNNTVFAISNFYNITQEDLKKYNPALENGLKEGMILRIPKTTNQTSKIVAEKVEPKTPAQNTVKQAKEHPKNNQIHVVQPNETLFSISRQYNVEVTEMIALNPASVSKLAVGTELNIPEKKIVTVVVKKDSVLKNVVKELEINKSQETIVLDKQSENNKTVRIAFLLPFMLNLEKKDASTDRFLDFYAGALLAIQEAKQKGTSFEIYSYDTDKSEEKLTEVLANPELKTVDLIIGPAFSNQVSLIADFAKENKISTLIPFSSKVADIDSNPYLFQFNPGTEVQLNYATELFTGKYKKLHLIFAEIPGVNSSDEGKIFSDGLKTELKKADKSYSTIHLTTSDAADFSGVCKPNEKNLIIFNTDKFAYVSPFISQLRTTSTSENIVLFEQYSWRNQPEKLPNGMYLSPFKQNQNPTKIDEYALNFAHYFGKSVSSDTPRFDLLGYDLSSYFISLFNNYGNKIGNKIGSFNFTNGLQSNPYFQRSSKESGFVNQRVYLVED